MAYVISKNKMDIRQRLSNIPTSELVQEILRRGEASLYGDFLENKEGWLRISYNSMVQRSRPANRMPNPEHWGKTVGIATE